MSHKNVLAVMIAGLILTEMFIILLLDSPLFWKNGTVAVVGGLGSGVLAWLRYFRNTEHTTASQKRQAIGIEGTIFLIIFLVVVLGTPFVYNESLGILLLGMSGCYIGAVLLGFILSDSIQHHRAQSSH